MDYHKAERWLEKRGIIPEESFACALNYLAMGYQKNHKRTLDEVYAMLGIKKQHIFYWKNNPHSVQTKVMGKYKVIAKAGNVFKLDEQEKEILANKAGLSLLADGNFTAHLAELLSVYPDKKSRLRDMAMISDRMFRYIKSGKFLRKEALLALGISLGLEIDRLQIFMQKAGYCLSDSIHGDAVVKWILTDGKLTRSNPVMNINEVLDSLGLPLLMTRLKNESQN